MTPAERHRVVEALPSWMVDASPPEGEFHGEACDLARDTLREFFRTRSPGVHVGSDLPVYYPGEPQFCPDLFVVFDVEPGKRNRWVVSAEGRGLDFVLEVVYRGSREKDFVENLARYARLGIPEYFIFDLDRGRLSGHRLAEGGGRYVPILPQYGRHTSQVLGMDLVLEADGLQFYNHNARLLSPPELALRLKQTLEAVELRLVEAEQAREQGAAAEEAARRVAEEESKRAEEESKRAEEAAKRAEEESKRASAAERRLAEALAELARLKGG